MSVSSADGELKRARSALEDARKKQAAEEKRAAAAEAEAAAKERSATRTSVDSSARSYLRQAQSKREAANKARMTAAGHATKAAQTQANVHKAEQKLAKAQADEAKKRDTEERRQRDKAEWAAKEAQRERDRAERVRREADAVRDASIRDVGATLTGLGDEVFETRALVESRPWENAPQRITVLVLAAEPDGQDRLRIDRELREIQEQVRSSELRDSIVFELRHAVRFGDLIQHLNETEPDVIHFSGHGSSGGLALHGDDDTTKALTNDQLDRVLSVAPKPLTLVVFNSCDSAEQARVAVKYAAAAIAMDEPIGDEVARVFAGQLYNSLGFGRSLGLALRQAQLFVEMQLDDTFGEPTLVLADGVNADELIVVDPKPKAA